MKGVYKVIVENKRLEYHLQLRRKITIIRGDSGTGKTRLLRMINDSKCDKIGTVRSDTKYLVQS